MSPTRRSFPPQQSRALAVLAACLLTPVVHAQPKPGALPAALTNPSAVYSVPAESRPAYLKSFSDPTFNSTVMRIAADPGASTSPISGTWGTDTWRTFRGTWRAEWR